MYPDQNSSPTNVSIILLHSNIPMVVTDDTWHHVCVVWDGESGLLAVFKDGERNHQSTRFRTGSLNVIIEGK